MTEPEIDYAAVFRALPGAVALLTPQLLYVDANDGFLGMRDRTREQVIGHHLTADVSDPNDPAGPLVDNLQASLRRVAESGERDTGLQRVDMTGPNRPGVRDERYYSLTNAPVFGPDGRVVLLLHRVEEVTELIRAREVALSLQEAMLPAPRPVGRHGAAVRYRPAVGALNVCGDWYDLVDLSGDRVAVAVGDVVGKGLSAAGVMGQLRSALSAVFRVVDGPAQALEVLGLYARSIDGAENTTVANTFIDWDTHTITYSSAGHPPPALVHIDGTVEFLDRATDPHSAPDPNMSLGLRPPSPSPRAPSSCCTPTA